MSEKLKAAEARREAARGELAGLEKELASVDAQLAEQQKVLGRVAELEEVSQADVVARENAERKARRIKEQRAALQAKVAAAANAFKAAVREARSLAAAGRLERSLAALRADSTALADFLDGEIAKRVLERLEAHQKLLQELRAADLELKELAGSPAKTPSAFRTPWSAIDPKDLWDSLAEAFRGIAAERVRAEKERRENTPEALEQRVRKQREAERNLRAAQRAAEDNPYGTVLPGPQPSEQELADRRAEAARRMNPPNPYAPSGR